MAIDTDTLRRQGPGEIAEYFRTYLSTSTRTTITHELLAAIESGAIPPTTFAIWLGVTRSSETIQQALQQSISIQVRKYGIGSLRKILHSARWKEMWDEFGDTAGFLDLFSRFSVREVRSLCSAFGSSLRPHDSEEKKEKITELLKALLPHLFPEASLHTKDQRPLGKHYERIVPGCTSEFVSEQIVQAKDGNWEHVHHNYLLRCHTAALKPYVIDTIFGTASPKHNWLEDLLRRYPSSVGPIPGFSTSMSFSFEVLQRLAAGEASTISKKSFVEELARPLVRRIMKRMPVWQNAKDVVELIVRYIELHPQVASYIDRDQNGLLHLVAQCWARMPELLGPSFGALLRQVIGKKKQIFLGEFDELLINIARTKRYPLLRFCHKEVANQDLDSEADLKNMKGWLGFEAFDTMNVEDALGLLTRLRATRGDEDIVGKGQWTSITCIGSSPTSTGGDAVLVNAVLNLRCGKFDEAEALASPKVPILKTKAMQSSDPNTRSWYARAALNFAIASHNFELYNDTLVWARRFIRDPTAALTLYQYHNIEGVDLVCGVAERILSGSIDRTEVKMRVEKGNDIMRVLLETLRLSTREPSFYIQAWTGVLDQFYQIVRRRMERTKALKEALKLNDEEIYEILWPDTVKLLLETEQEFMKPNYVGQYVTKIGGVLTYQTSANIELEVQEPSTYRFLDVLAQARDELWRKYRPTVHPDSATLPNTYPRGLPIQNLISPFTLNIPSLEDACPYLALRAKDAVYPDTAAACQSVPEDEETRDAIGPFIDDYAFALSLLAPKCLDLEERKERVDKAWAYAIGPLSKSRMSEDEAVRYWESRPQDSTFPPQWPTYRPDSYVIGDWPTIPIVDDATEIEEWNPLPAPIKDLAKRDLGKLTYMDLMRAGPSTGSSYATVKSKLRTSEPLVPEKKIQEPEVFHWLRIQCAATWPAIREGQILAALLYVDSQVSSTNRILSTPFPSAEDVRYPCLYLDEKFLSKDISIDAALGAIRRHITHVPPKLLEQVVHNTINALDCASAEEPSVILESTAFKLVSLLAKSDRPELAAKLAVQTIIKRPEASSWHRQLLSPGFFRRLSAADARSCFQEFADTICAKLTQQAEARKKAASNAAANQEDSGDAKDNAADNDEPGQSKPFIKVTTVKFLAQLLKDSEFVSGDFSVQVLTSLLQKASHIDIKVAVVDSLVSMLDVASPGLAETIIQSLESIIPVAGNLHERSPFTEADWKDAEASLSPPEINYPIIPSTGSLRSSLRTVPYNSAHVPIFLQRIQLPVISRLKQETARWMAIFLRKHGLDAEAQRELALPIPPLAPPLWRSIMYPKAELVPASVLEEWVQYLIFCVNPPAAIAALNKKFRDDPALQSQPDVKFWLQTYGPGVRVISSSPDVCFRTLFSTKTQLDEGGITTQRVQTLFLNLFTVVLLSDAPRFANVAKLVEQTSPTFTLPWIQNVRPVVEAMVLYVESMRSKEWQGNANRHPQVLPDMYPQRLWLLDHPSKLGGDGSEAECRKLADQVARELDGMAGRVYHKRFSQLKSHLQTMDTADKLRLATYLGDVTKTKLSWLTMQDELRVELAAGLFSGKDGEVEWKEGNWYGAKDVGGEEADGLKARVKKMVEAWRVSENEEVRRLGFTVI